VAEKRPAKDREEDPPPEEAASGLAELLEPPAAESPSADVERRARLAEDRLSEVLVAYRKLKTDNETFRDRTTRNVERKFDQRHERLLLRFIDIMDNLDRALEAAQVNFASPPLVEGLILVRTQLLQTLKDEGLERIPVLGLAFDPHVSEAVATQPVEEAEHHNVVVKELQRGWRLKDRIARPARVVLGEYRDGVVPKAVAEEELELVEETSAKPAREGEPSLEDIIAHAQADEKIEAPPPAAPASPDSVLDGLLDEEPPSGDRRK
jgi:molecular chaperone GrpE (heat shock protein)